MQLMDLPLEVLSIIVTFLAISCDGARDLARASAICKGFKTLATQEDVLKVVNFQNLRLLDSYEPHHHIDGLLSRCVRAGSPTAACKLGEVILKSGISLWTKMLANDQQLSIGCAPGLPLPEQWYISESRKTVSIADVPFYLFCSKDIPHIHASYARLQHWRLVRSYLAQAEPREISEVFCRFEAFIIFFVRYDKVHESEILCAIKHLWFYDSYMRCGVFRRLRSGHHDVSRTSIAPREISFGSTGEVFPMPPPEGFSSLREQVLLACDSLFPPGM